MLSNDTEINNWMTESMWHELRMYGLLWENCITTALLMKILSNNRCRSMIVRRHVITTPKAWTKIVTLLTSTINDSKCIPTYGCMHILNNLPSTSTASSILSHYENMKPSHYLPWYQGSWGRHGVHLWPTGPRWASCWPHEHCYLDDYGPFVKGVHR